jgi:hypothetical protein
MASYAFAPRARKLLVSRHVMGRRMTTCDFATTTYKQEVHGSSPRPPIMTDILLTLATGGFLRPDN